jgi:DNA polymerase-3 subunit delta'
LPQIDSRALHALGEALSGTASEPLAVFLETVNSWLAVRLHNAPQECRRLARVGEVWEGVNQAAREVEIYNLDRKPFVFSVFNLLADAARA